MTRLHGGWRVRLAEVVILVEYADLGVRNVLQNGLAVDASRDEVIGIEAYRPRKGTCQDSNGGAESEQLDLQAIPIQGVK
jgi:hypothetical protein